jgi:catechol 2,3-dioxygenase-like lactoylglutathione lyase family enzyme
MPDVNATSIRKVATVFVPVANQDRALAFYIEKLGFEKRVDFQYGGDSRWIEVAPPGSAVALALVPPTEGKPAGSDQTHCALTSENIEADHATLRERGVAVDALISRMGNQRQGLVSLDVSIPNPVPAQFFFRDTDGNRFLIVETGT